MRIDGIGCVKIVDIMRNIKAALLWWRRLPWWISILFSLALVGWSHLDRVHRQQVRAQQQTTLDAINRDCAQLQSESDAHYRRGEALIKNKHWTKEDMAFAEGFSKKSKALETHSAAIQRRCREFNASAREQ